MYLRNLTLSRYRSFERGDVTLRPDLTVLVGENNGGKSNVIDAIRLLTLPLSGRRERFPEEEDIARLSVDRSFEIAGLYAGLSDVLKGLLISGVTDPTKDEAIFGLRYEGRATRPPRGRSILWAGRFVGNEPEAGSTDVVRHVYLPPLRDAHQALGSGSGARVMALLRHFLTKEEEEAFLASVSRKPEAPAVLTTMNRQIGAALDELTSGVRPQSALLDFSAESLLDVARDLRFRLADAGLQPEDIRASGLGYSNLLYMATVVVELAKAREADLTIFLVEEPEAHLHPQLQTLVLEFLREQSTQAEKRPPEPGRPEGQIQVVVTTHSPNLTASVSPEHLVVVRFHTTPGTDQAAGAPAGEAAATTRRLGQAGTAAEVPDGDARGVEVLVDGVGDDRAGGNGRTSVCIPVASLGLKPRTLSKLERYLDVTRSALLFGNRTILVEGIAEALLLPVIARNLVLHEDHEGWRRFKGAVIVPIEGVDFRPYVEVLLRPVAGARIADRVVVVTDADPAVPGNRRADLEALAAKLGAAAALSVKTNQRTLEHECFAAGNEAFLRKAFLRLHRRSQREWSTQIEGVPAPDRPLAFVHLLQAKRARKGDLAQMVAYWIEAGEPFVTPEYLAEAIRESARA